MFFFSLAFNAISWKGLSVPPALQGDTYQGE
jgi:hypothetical protein